MTSSLTVQRTLMTYGLSLILAVVLGFLLADWKNFFNFSLVAMIMLALATPILMRWHHLLLVLSLNATVIVYFLPGQPYVWMLLSGISLGFAVLRRTLEPESSFFYVPAVVWPLIALTLVILITAQLTGGIGFRVIGSGVYGGKRYYTTLAAVVVFFALISQPIPLSRASLMAGGFFLTGITGVFSNLAFVLGPAFYGLYALFPAELAQHQARAEYLAGMSFFSRVTGISWAGFAVFAWMLIRYGARGVLNFSKPWRMAAFLGVMALTMMGGFRSYVVMFALILGIQFFLEKFYRTRTFLALVMCGIVGAIVLAPNVERLPLSVQRSLSIVPFLKVSPLAAWDAQHSSEWRLSIWKLLVTEIPDHLIQGKGYAIDPTELYLLEESVKRGLAKSYEYAMVAGDYHNGPLSVLIPFGVFGLMAFLWFCAASLWVLIRNQKFGDPQLKHINTFFLAYFIAKLVFFFAVFGALNSDLVILTSLVGLSISLNHGVARKPANPQAPQTLEALEALEAPEAAQA